MRRMEDIERDGYHNVGIATSRLIVLGGMAIVKLFKLGKVAKKTNPDGKVAGRVLE